MTRDAVIAARQRAQDAAWKALVSNCRGWATNHMDQWEKFKFHTVYGTVYVTISRQDPFPDDFDRVDMIGRPVSDAPPEEPTR